MFEITDLNKDLKVYFSECKQDSADHGRVDAFDVSG